MLMGGTLPVLVRADIGSSFGLGARLGRLYAANTAGAVAGTALAGFVLLPRVGLQASLWIAAGINAGLGIAVLWLFRESTASGPEDRRERPPARPEGTGGWMSPRVAAAAVVVSGFCALFYEVLWTRALQLVIGNSTHAFSLMLATFLAGLSVGIWVSGRLVRSRRPFEPVLWLTLAGIGVTAFASIVLIRDLPEWFLVLYRRFGAVPVLFTAWQALLCAAVLFIPSLLIGMVFPLVVEFVRRPRTDEARQIGRLHALNTMGTIGGALAAGLVVIPTLGMHQSLIVGMWISLALAALIATRTPGETILQRASVSVACLLLAGTLTYWAPRWDPILLTSGTYVSAERYMSEDAERFRATKMAQELLYYREGATGTVTVRASGPNRVLAIDGRAEGNTGAIAQVLMGHLPFLFGRSIKDVLVIGMGTGSTAGAAATYPVEAVEVIEIEPAVIEASSFFEAINHRPLANPKVRVWVTDARSYLRAAPPSSRDVIISQPSTPWVPGAAKLFTAEFYEMAKQRLRPDGMFVQWVQLYNMDFAAVTSVLGTFTRSFPQTLAFEVGRRSGELVLVGSTEPLSLSWEALRDLYAEPGLAGQLSEVHLDGSGSVLAQLLLGPAELASLVRGASLNTDDNGLLEFSARATLYERTTESNTNRLREYATPSPWRHLNASPRGTERHLTLVEMARNSLHRLDFERGLVSAQDAVSLERTVPALRILGDLRYVHQRSDHSVRAWREALEREPSNVAVLRRLVRHYNQPRYQWTSPDEIVEWRVRLAAAGDPLGRSKFAGNHEGLESP